MNLYSNVYYHIQRPGFKRAVWKKGDTVIVSKDSYNSFYANLISGLGDFESNDGKHIDLIEYSSCIFEKNYNEHILSKHDDYKSLYYEFENKSQLYESLAKKLQGSLFQYLKWVREVIFEKKRIEIDSHLPSRMSCIWVTTFEDLPKWWKLFESENDNRILEIKLHSTNLHKADGRYINTKTVKLDRYYEMAKDYWNGEIQSNNEVEYLYQGRFDVINEFNKLQDVTNHRNSNKI